MIKQHRMKKNFIRVDPIIAVKDVEASSKWYQNIFNCRSLHGGHEFDVLVTENNEVLICLHQWGTHDHPTMTAVDLPVGNGLILYFRTDHLKDIRERVDHAGGVIEADIHINPNSGKNEFTVWDPDGYFITISDFHTYEG